MVFLGQVAWVAPQPYPGLTMATPRRASNLKYLHHVLGHHPIRRTHGVAGRLVQVRPCAAATLPSKGKPDNSPIERTIQRKTSDMLRTYIISFVCLFGVSVPTQAQLPNCSQAAPQAVTQSISVLDTGRLDADAASIPAGGFPRELRITSDGKMKVGLRRAGYSWGWPAGTASSSDTPCAATIRSKLVRLVSGLRD